MAQIVKYDKNNVWLDDDETRPAFPGGPNAFRDFLKKNIHYKKGNTDERLLINFTIKKDGSLKDFKIKRGKNKLNIQEAIRVLKLSPRWKPGTMHRKIVEVQYSIPITFTH